MTIILLWIGACLVLHAGWTVIENQAAVQEKQIKLLSNQKKSRTMADAFIEFDKSMYKSSSNTSTGELDAFKKMEERIAKMNRNHIPGHGYTPIMDRQAGKVRATNPKFMPELPKTPREFKHYVKVYNINNRPQALTLMSNAFESTYNLKEVFTEALLHTDDKVLVKFVSKHTVRLDNMMDNITKMAKDKNLYLTTYNSYVMLLKEQRVTWSKEFNKLVKENKKRVESEHLSTSATQSIITEIRTLSSKLTEAPVTIDSRLIAKAKVLSANTDDIIELYNMTDNKSLHEEAIRQLTIIRDTLTDDIDRAKLPGTDSYVKELLSINSIYLNDAKDT